MIVWLVLLWTLRVVVGLLLLVIVVCMLFFLAPITYSVRAYTSPDNHIRISISHLFWLVRFEYMYPKHVVKLRVLGIVVFRRTYPAALAAPISAAVSTAHPTDQTHTAPPPSAHTEQVPPPPPHSEPEKKASAFKTISKLLTSGDESSIIALCHEAAKMIWCNTKPKLIDIEGGLGFDCPAKTGMFVGLYEAVASSTGLRTAIRLYGIFDCDTFTMRVQGRLYGRFHMYQILRPIIWLFRHKNVRDFAFSKSR